MEQKAMKTVRDVIMQIRKIQKYEKELSEGIVKADDLGPVTINEETAIGISFLLEEYKDVLEGMKIARVDDK